jgi:plastocyanin
MTGMIGCGEEAPADPGNGGSTNHTPSAPTIDTGAGTPADGSTDQSVTSILHWACDDPDGDALTFDVFFGTSADPPSVVTGQSGESYDPGTLAYSTTYHWKIVAEDPEGETAGSAVWNFTTIAQPAETVGAPGAPTGPTAGGTYESLSYTASGSSSNLGHTVEYRFDWGDGTFSSWQGASGASHSWAAAGTYVVMAQGRCAAHTTAVSEWSNPVTVEIVDTENISTPVGDPTGEITIDPGQTVSFILSSTSSLGHEVEYYVDWGDGETSDWTVSNSPNHIYTIDGDHECRVQARCREHTGIVSDWKITTVHVTEKVSTPTIGGPSTARVGAHVTFTTSDAVSTSGHYLEHRLLVRSPGDTYYLPQEWTTEDNLIYIFDTAGVYRLKVQARCIKHQVESAESASAFIVIED